LIAICNDLEVVSCPKELIILKDAEGQLQPYHDSRSANRMRRDVFAQNEAIEHLKLMISDACEACDAHGRLGAAPTALSAYTQRPRLLAVLATAAAVPTDVVARAAQQAGATGPKIGEAIHRARVEAVAASLA
jgi:hypothetical protein